MDFENITDLLIKNHGDAITVNEEKNIIFVSSEKWLGIAKDLKDNKDLTFDYLSCVTGYDNGVGESLGVAYNFYSMVKKHALEVRIEVSRDTPEIPSIEKVWRTADWMEREVFDLYGIKFTNHWDLRRILLPADWEGYPLRKDYKEPDYYNGMPVPKDKSYWE
jgi:NADH-quinone oxidoreductase subunit C